MAAYAKVQGKQRPAFLEEITAELKKAGVIPQNAATLTKEDLARLLAAGLVEDFTRFKEDLREEVAQAQEELQETAAELQAQVQEGVSCLQAGAQDLFGKLQGFFKGVEQAQGETKPQAPEETDSLQHLRSREEHRRKRQAWIEQQEAATAHHHPSREEDEAAWSEHRPQPQAAKSDIPSAAAVVAQLQEERRRKEEAREKRVAEARYLVERTSYLGDFNHQLEARPGQAAKVAVNDKESGKRFQQELEAQGWVVTPNWEDEGLPLVLALIITLPEGK